MKKSDFLNAMSLAEHKNKLCKSIYLMFKDEDLVYIGMTENIPIRIKTHNIVKKSEYDSCFYLSFPFETGCEGGLSRAVEKALIKHFKPTLNRDEKKNALTFPEVWLIRQLFGDDVRIKY